MLITLKTGVSLDTKTVGQTMTDLTELFTKYHRFAVELVELCRHPKRSIVTNSIAGRSMIESKLIGMDGRPLPHVRQILLAAIEGEGTEMRLGMPVEDWKVAAIKG